MNYVKIHNIQNTADGYVNTRIAIIKQAIDDYKQALHSGDKSAIIALERWFLSCWGEMLSGGNGAYIIEKVRNEVNKK